MFGWLRLASTCASRWNRASLERLPLVVGHYEVELAVVRLVDLVDCADVGMVKGRCRLRLLEKPLFGGVVASQIRREQLDGHLTLETRVLGGVDDAHAAVAEFGGDRVRAERRA